MNINDSVRIKLKMFTFIVKE